jgi:o-succinylbenzoate---CoA ligase
LSFAHCSDLAYGLQLPRLQILSGDNSQTEIIALYAALANGVPVGLVHRKHAVASQVKQRQQLLAADLHPSTCVVAFTSGSTAAPRGVVISRDALRSAAAMSAHHLGWRDDDRWLLSLSIAHVGGLNVVLRCLAAGKCVVIADDHDAVSMALRDGTASIASLVPTQLAALLATPGWRPSDRVRAMLLGGAAASTALLANAAAVGCRVLTTYGATETCGQVVTASLANATTVSAAVGSPLRNVVLTAGSRQDPNVIEIQSPSLFDRYLDQPVTTKNTTWKTSDVGYLTHDGQLVVIGRADDVVISGGENVHPTFVEAVLLATPGVTAAVVFAIPDPQWGMAIATALVVSDQFSLAVATQQWRQQLASTVACGHNRAANDRDRQN